MPEYHYKTAGFARQGPISAWYDDLPAISEACVTHFHRCLDPNWQPGVTREFEIYYDGDLYDTVTAKIRVEPTYEIDNHE